MFSKYLQEGFVRAFVDGEIVELDHDISLEKNKKHTIEIIVERLILKEESRSRVRTT